MTIAFKVVIPARYGSTRLPGKPLLKINGKEMILHVIEKALVAGAEQVVVATDDQRILDKVTSSGFEVVMTNPNHQSGTERIHEVAEILSWNPEDIIVNLQGDEPLIPSTYISDVALALANQDRAGIATLASRIVDEHEIFNPNAVKVVLDACNYALYFSRAPIPWDRDNFGSQNAPSQIRFNYLRHIGIYAYSCEFLQQYCEWKASPLESIESLEQLRILWHGQAVLVKTVNEIPPAGVDTLEDLTRVEKIIKNS